jgi:hypothetical protein
MELLLMVVDYIPTNCLSSFALVCHACHEFARWRQFSAVSISKIYDSEFGRGLLSKVCAEAALGMDDQRMGYDLQPSPVRLGAFIQELVMRTDARSFLEIMGPAPPKSYHFHHNEMIQASAFPKFRDQEATTYYSTHLQKLAFAIQHSMPRIRKMRFEDKVPIPRGMWNVLIHKNSLQDLDLFACIIGTPVEPPLVASVTSWPLTSLRINITEDRVYYGNFQQDADQFCAQILRITAPTLRSLRLSCCNSANVHRHNPLSLEGMEDISFSSLADVELNLECNTAFYRAVLHSSSKLEAICLTVTATFPTFGRLWPGRSLEYPSLKCLSVNRDSFDRCPILTVLPLLRENNQIEILRLEQGFDLDCLLQSHVLPLLGASFMHLTSLSLTVRYEYMRDDRLLQLIGTILTLHQLQLKVVRSSEHRHPWPIIHKSVRRCLSNIEGLQRLSLTGDTYKCGKGCPRHLYYRKRRLERDGGSAYEEKDDDTTLPPDYDYYSSHDFSSHSLSMEKSLMPADRPAPTWAYEHEQRMLRHARNYFVKFRHLEWVHFGCLIMGPSRVSRSHRPQVIGERRDHLVEAYMDWAFGWQKFVSPELERNWGYGMDYHKIVLG